MLPQKIRIPTFSLIIMKNLTSFFATTFLIISTAFAQRISPNKPVIIKVTSTECNVCGLKAWDELKEAIDLYEDKAVIMSVHPLELSSLFSTTSLALAENMPQFFGTPTFYVNTELQPFNFWLGNAKQDVEAFQKRQTIAHPAINYTIEGNELTVEVNTRFYKEVARPHHLSVFVLEDEVTEIQESRGLEDKHSKVLRTHLGETVFGTPLSAAPIDANQTFTNNYTLTLEDNWNPDNIEIAVIIWEHRTEKFVVINANVATEPVSLSTSTNFLETAQVGLTIQPTILVDVATVNVTLPTDLTDLNLRLVNTLGQNVQTVFSGDLPKGNHSFLVNRNDFKASGLYFLVLEKNGSQLIQKVILR